MALANKVDDNQRLEKLSYQNLNRSEAEIILLRGTLAEIYCVLKDHRSRGIDNVMFHIESVYPCVKSYV